MITLPLDKGIVVHLFLLLVAVSCSFRSPTLQIIVVSGQAMAKVFKTRRQIFPATKRSCMLHAASFLCSCQGRQFICYFYTALRWLLKELKRGA